MLSQSAPVAPHRYPDADVRGRTAALEGIVPEHAPKLWMPRRVLITPSARAWPLAATVAERAAALGAEIHELRSDRLGTLRGESERDTYVRSKTTLAVFVSPPSQRTLQPIPPSADWQFHLARACPAHCQYCYLAGSLPGPPVTRLYANLPEILDGLRVTLGEVPSRRCLLTEKTRARRSKRHAIPIRLRSSTSAAHWQKRSRSSVIGTMPSSFGGLPNSTP